MILEERPDDPGASEDSDQLQEDSSNPKVGAEEGCGSQPLVPCCVARPLRPFFPGTIETESPRRGQSLCSSPVGMPVAQPRTG